MVVVGGLSTGSVAAEGDGSDVVIVDQSGVPVAGAEVIVYRNPSESQVRSMRVGEQFVAEVLVDSRGDGDGVVSLPELPDRRSDYTVLVSGDGVLPEPVFVDEITDDGSVLASGFGRRIEVTRVRAKRRAAERCATSYGKLVVAKADGATRDATVGNVFSRTKHAKMSLNWSSGGDVTLGVGVEHTYKGVGVRSTTTRQIANNLNITFPDLKAVGRRVQKTAAYYVKWRFTQDVVTTCGSSAKHERRVWHEWRPEGLNGHSRGSVKIDAMPAPPPDRNYCAWIKQRGKGQTVTSGQATRTDGAISLYGFSLSAQAGHSKSISVTVVADTGPIGVCGYAGPAGTDPGQLVAIPY